MHTLAALLLTGLLSAGLAGLGDLVGGRSAGDRWVRGWTLLWWLVAVVAQLASPRVAVALVSLSQAAGAHHRMTRQEMEPVITDAGVVPRQRRTRHELL